MKPFDIQYDAQVLQECALSCAAVSKSNIDHYIAKIVCMRLCAIAYTFCFTSLGFELQELQLAL